MTRRGDRAEGHQRGDLTDTLRSAPTWTDDLVDAAGIPIVDVPFVTVGGGFGSFVVADVLRIAGVPTDEIRVVSELSTPWQQYRRLATNSQIPPHERLRSDSASTPDNIWGFPSYAVRESWETRSLRPLLQVLTEPVLTEYFTPRAEQVYRTTTAEAERIGWDEMRMPGRARMVRRRVGGSYYTLVTPPAGTTPTKRIALRSHWVHLAVGYPGVRFLPDLQAHRQQHRDFHRVVNAYEPHDHVYDALVGEGGDVVVRGSGIVASRILQRLLDDVGQRRASTRIWHLFRSWVDAPQGPPRFRRDGANGFAYQAFNYPKAAWGGTLREELLGREGAERAALILAMGGTNTPKRADWVEQLDKARRAGIYRSLVGEVETVVPSTDGRLLTKLRLDDGESAAITSDFIIDATGLDGEVRDSQLLDDLLTHSGAQENVLGRIGVTPTFEVSGTRSGPGRLYASGAMTLGGPYAPVDSFLGLQYAAIQIADDLAEQGFGHRIGPARSLSQWVKWMRHRSPG